jgi:hypothetical protein
MPWILFSCHFVKAKAQSIVLDIEKRKRQNIKDKFVDETSTDWTIKDEARLLTSEDQLFCLNSTKSMWTRKFLNEQILVSGLAQTCLYFRILRMY